MNKSTNNFRKCQYCPHHDQKKQCCCQTRQSVHSVKTKLNSRGKSKTRTHNKNKQLDNSTISYINTTLPITNNSTSIPHFSNNILAQNSILRTENDYLKRQLTAHNPYSYIPHSISSFSKQPKQLTVKDYNVSTMPSSQNDTSRTYHLHDKLYVSNRNLQEALIQLDNLSKVNKELHQSNTKINLQKEQIRIMNQELYEDNLKLKKKCKKLTKIVQNMPSQIDVQKIMRVNEKLERDNCQLRNQIQELRQQLKRVNVRSRTIVQVQNLSPQWVAHTSNKINILQKNISRLQQQNKQNTSFSQNCSFLRSPQQDPNIIKSQLISTIKVIKAQSNSSKSVPLASYSFSSFSSFSPSLSSSSPFSQLLQLQNCTLISLVKLLCESLMQPILMYCLQVQKNTERTVKNYQAKLDKVVNKIQNMIIKVQNQRLRVNANGGIRRF